MRREIAARRFRRSRARGQGDNHRVLIVRRMILAGHADFLNGAHALTHQNIAKISRPDDIVGDGAEENGIFPPLLRRLYLASSCHAPSTRKMPVYPSALVPG